MHNQSMNNAWSSEMTFGEFIVGIYNRAEFPCDKYLRFSSRTQGDKMGELLLGLLRRSAFRHDPNRSREDSYVSTHVFSLEDVTEYSHGTSNWELVIELRVYGTRRDRDRAAGFPPRSTIEVECMGYPF